MNSDFILIGVVVMAAGINQNYTMLMGNKLALEFEKSCGPKQMRRLTILVGAGVYILGTLGMDSGWLWQVMQRLA